MLQSRWSAHFRNLTFPDGSPQACGAGLPAWLYRGRATGFPAMVKAELEFFANRNHIQDRFGAVWKMLARHYLHNARVIGSESLFEAYDLANADYPGAGDVTAADLNLAGFYERIGRAVHAVNPKWLTVIPDTLSYGPNPKSAITRRPKVTNPMYGFEFYGHDWFQRGKKRLEAFHERAAGWGMPGLITEFTAFGKITEEPTPHWKRQTLALLHYAKTHYVSWSVKAGPDDMTPELLRVLRTGF
jgi:hypothetical protein